MNVLTFDPLSIVAHAGAQPDADALADSSVGPALVDMLQGLAPAMAEDGAEACAMIDDTGQMFRLVEIPDRFRKDREDWLGSFLRWYQVRTYRNGEIDFLTQHDVSFDILIISGDDKPRVQSITRTVRKLLPSKLVVVLLANCTRQDKVRFLGAGADDVLHLGMKRTEAVMRLHALQRRLAWSLEKARAEELKKEERRLEKQALDGLVHTRLTTQESAVLELLLKRQGHVVGYREFVQVRNGSSMVATTGTLAVVMTHIRKKLRRDWQIANKRGEGFVLENINGRGRRMATVAEMLVRSAA